MSWEPTIRLDRGDAFKALSRLIFEFDRDLRPDVVKVRNGEVAVLWWRPDGINATVTAIRSSSAVDGSRVIVRALDDDVKQAFELADTGTVVIDLNCDLVLDGQGLPVSSSTTSLVGVHLARAGGIMRTWLLVRG